MLTIFDTVAPSTGEVMATTGGVVSAVCNAALFTDTVTEADPMLLAASKALTVMVCDPLALLALFHEKEKGEEVAVATAAPSTSSSILVTPTLSEADPCTETLPETLAPETGAVMETVGGVVSIALLTLSVTRAEPILPAAS